MGYTFSAILNVPLAQVASDGVSQIIVSLVILGMDLELELELELEEVVMLLEHHHPARSTGARSSRGPDCELTSRSGG